MYIYIKIYHIYIYHVYIYIHILHIFLNVYIYIFIYVQCIYCKLYANLQVKVQSGFINHDDAEIRTERDDQVKLATTVAVAKLQYLHTNV